MSTRNPHTEKILSAPDPSIAPDVPSGGLVAHRFPEGPIGACQHGHHRSRRELIRPRRPSLDRFMSCRIRPLVCIATISAVTHQLAAALNTVIGLENSCALVLISVTIAATEGLGRSVAGWELL